MRYLVVLFPALLASCATPRPTDDQAIGAQLYTVRAAMASDAQATLRRVAALGYTEVEFAGIFGNDPATLCRTVQELSMRVAAAHADWRLLRDNPAAAIAEAKALCADTLILAWMPEEERATADQWRGWVARLNTIAPLAKAEGLTLAYHAHDFEFAVVGGIRPIDLLMEQLDPSIGFELDTYWLAKAGEDPLVFLVEQASRVTHLHVKDMAADGSMADVGAGTLDLTAIMAQARKQGVRHLLVERDDAPDPWASLASSLDSARAMSLQR